MIFNPHKLLRDKEYCKKLFKHYIKTKALRKTNPNFEKYISKAMSNLELANFLFEEHNYSIKEKLPNKDFYDWCITIYYYSIYHASLALIAKLGYKSNSHLATLATITLFYYHKDNVLKEEDVNFLLEKINLEEKEIDFVIESKNLRERACYGVDESFNLSITKMLQKQTADFVNKIKEMLDVES
ncbi:hypothetical protein J4232_04305 [Candidatus Woesearchaeota archaeon]|nr:hypothetical protein [Candidatus Woesearchaeota archaeon]